MVGTNLYCKGYLTVKLNHRKLEKIYSDLKVDLAKDRMTWRFLLNKDASGGFKALQSIAHGLKPSVALLSLKNNLFCLRCHVNLAKFKVCPTCLETSEGKVFSRGLRDSTFQANWATKSKAELRKIALKREATSLENWGVTQPLQSKEVQKKIRKSLLNKYGVDNQFKADAVKKKSRATLLERYGVENISQRTETKEKKVETSLRNRGVENPSQADDVKAKKTITCQRNYGTEHPLQSPVIKRRAVASNRKNWGADHPRQNAEFFARVNKLGYVYRPVVINGKEIQVQGYEDRVLKSLESKIKRITTDPPKMPRITYRHKGKHRRYYPDALICTHDGRSILLEVKSTWTLSKPDVIPKAQAAFKFCQQFSNLRYMIAVHRPGIGTHWITSLGGFKIATSNIINTKRRNYLDQESAAI